MDALKYFVINIDDYSETPLFNKFVDCDLDSMDLDTSNFLVMDIIHNTPNCLDVMFYGDDYDYGKLMTEMEIKYDKEEKNNFLEYNRGMLCVFEINKYPEDLTEKDANALNKFDNWLDLLEEQYGKVLMVRNATYGDMKAEFVPLEKYLKGDIE